MDAEKDFGLLIKQINDIIEKNANAMLREDDMTFSQLRILSYINECDGHMVTLKDIERNFLIAQPTVVGIVKRLAGKGLVTVRTDDADRRVKNAFITEQGAEFCVKVGRRKEEMRQRLVKNLSSAEIVELDRLLMQVHKSLVE